MRQHVLKRALISVIIWALLLMEINGMSNVLLYAASGDGEILTEEEADSAEGNEVQKEACQKEADDMEQLGVGNSQNQGEIAITEESMNAEEDLEVDASPDPEPLSNQDDFLPLEDASMTADPTETESQLDLEEAGSEGALLLQNDADTEEGSVEIEPSQVSEGSTPSSDDAASKEEEAVSAASPVSGADSSGSPDPLTEHNPTEDADSSSAEIDSVESEKEKESGAESAMESAPDTWTISPDLADEQSLIPAGLVSDKDLAAIVGEGIDVQIDDQIDAVKEILNSCPSDEGLLQFAAQEAGYTSKKAMEAAEILSDENTVLPSEVAEALVNAGIADQVDLQENESLLEQLLDAVTVDVEAAGDHQNGSSISYVPADTKEEAMAYLSSFLLSDVKDGAGDWDDPRGYTPQGNHYDWNGNDSDAHNSVVRTNDDVTYTFSYTTALTDTYIYNTIKGTKLYVEYTLPLSTNEAVFHLEAMPWLMGEGENQSPLVYYTLLDGSVVNSLAEGQTAVSQRLVGYRELPDRTEETGVSYDVPGAGTINCVISVKEMMSKKSLEPEFHAWLEVSGGNDRCPDSELSKEAGNPKQIPSVMVTSGPYVSLLFKSKNYFPWTLPKFHTFTYYDEGLRPQSGAGRIKGVHFEIIAGKPNGTTKGSTSIDPSKPVTVSFSLSAWTSDPAGSSCGLYDLRTGDMGMGEGGRLTDERIRYYFHGDGNVIAAEAIGEGMLLGDSPSTDKWAGVITDLRAFEGTYSFEIEGYEHSAAGETLSTGEIFFYQEMPEYNTVGDHYYGKVTVPEVSAVSLLDPSSPRSFSQTYLDKEGNLQTTSATVENSVEGSGTWDSHLNMRMGLNAPLWGGDTTSVSASFPYGRMVHVYKFLNTEPRSSADQQQSMLEFILWDNTKVTLPEQTGDAGVAWIGRNYGSYGSSWRTLFITTISGDPLDAEEMKRVSLLSYRDLRYFTTRQEAVSYLQGRGKSEENIIGLVMEWFGQEAIAIGQKTLFEFDLQLAYRSDVPPEQVIGTTVQLTQNVIAFHGLVLKRDRSIGGPGGLGEMITSAELGDARMIWPNGDRGTSVWDAAGDIAGRGNGARTYSGTRWISEGHVDVASLTPNNNVHEGNTFYVSGYQFTVTSNIVRETIGGEAVPALTVDLGGRETVTYEVKPSFDQNSGVQGVSGYLLLPSPADERGNTACLEWKGIYAVKTNGEVLSLKTDGSRYQMSDFVEGAKGSFFLTTENGEGNDLLLKYFNEGTYTNDYYDGKIFLLLPAQNTGQALTGDDHPSLSAKDEGNAGQQYCLIKTGRGYVIRNAATGKYLASSGTLDGDAVVRKDTYNVEWTASTCSWYLDEHDDGSVSIRSAVNPSLIFYMPGNASGTEVRIKTDDNSLSGNWFLKRVGGETAGISVSFEGLSDESGLPAFYPEYRLIRGAVSNGTMITQRAVVAGDSYTGDPASAKDHVSSTGLDFVEVFSNVIKETVDTAEVKLSELKQGKKIRYEISYTNLYHSDHSFELLDELPHTGDEDGSELKTGASIQIESLGYQTDGGSSVQVSSASEANAAGCISSSGVLHSGETLVISYLLSVSGVSGGNALRNSTVLKDEFGTVRSNRVETLIKGMSGEAKIYKQVNRISNDIGELHTWTVTASLPEDIYADESVVFHIIDQLDPVSKRLAYEGNAAVMLVPLEFGSNGNPKICSAEEGTLLSSADDFLLSEPKKGSAGQTVELTMTKAGLAKLEAGAKDHRALQLCFDTSIRENAVAGVHIPNHAVLEYGVKNEEPGDLKEARNPEPDPYVFTGDIPILKRDSSTKQALPGAAFTLYRDEALLEPFQRGGDPYSLLTGQDGKAVFHGVKDGTYYLMETRAAPGHELSASAFKVVVLDGILVSGSEIRFDDQQHIVLKAGGAGKRWLNLFSAALLLLALFLQVLKSAHRW